LSKQASVLPVSILEAAAMAALAGLNISILAIFDCLIEWTLRVDINGSTIVGGNFELASNQLSFFGCRMVLKQ
jgi:hypothetical protein